MWGQPSKPALSEVEGAVQQGEALQPATDDSDAAAFDPTEFENTAFDFGGAYVGAEDGSLANSVSESPVGNQSTSISEN